MDENRLDRLAEIAVELARRVREDDPDDNAAWLHANTTAAERDALHYVQAAAAPTTEIGFMRAKAWAAKPPPITVDEIAVERACQGEKIPLNRLERAAAVVKLKRRGLSDNAIATLLGISRRTVVRKRNAA